MTNLAEFIKRVVEFLLPLLSLAEFVLQRSEFALSFCQLGLCRFQV